MLLSSPLGGHDILRFILWHSQCPPHRRLSVAPYRPPYSLRRHRLRYKTLSTILMYSRNRHSKEGEARLSGAKFAIRLKSARTRAVATRRNVPPRRILRKRTSDW